VSYLSTTQNSLPVAGQALPDGISTRKVPMKGFKVVDYISSSFPKLSWRNCIDFSIEAHGRTRIGVAAFPTPTRRNGHRRKYSGFIGW
jgi:hypothetical protein